MPSRLERLTILFAAVAIVAPVNASSQSLTSPVAAPIAIRTCRVDPSYVASSNPFYGPAQQSDGGDVRLGFVNNGKVDIVSVRFVVMEGAYKQRLFVDGRFVHGVTVERTFKEDSSANGNEDATCTVAHIRYADGSSWPAS